MYGHSARDLIISYRAERWWLFRSRQIQFSCVDFTPFIRVHFVPFLSFSCGDCYFWKSHNTGGSSGKFIDRHLSQSSRWERAWRKDVRHVWRNGHHAVWTPPSWSCGCFALSFFFRSFEMIRSRRSNHYPLFFTIWSKRSNRGPYPLRFDRRDWIVCFFVEVIM